MVSSSSVTVELFNVILVLYSAEKWEEIYNGKACIMAFTRLFPTLSHQDTLNFL